MAKKASKVDKSQLIRDLLTTDPNADLKTIKAHLKQNGVKASSTLIYYVKGKMKQTKRKAKKALVAASPQTLAFKNPVELVLRVKDLAQEVGGIKHLKKLVDLLAE